MRTEPCITPLSIGRGTLYAARWAASTYTYIKRMTKCRGHAYDVVSKACESSPLETLRDYDNRPSPLPWVEGALGEAVWPVAEHSSCIYLRRLQRAVYSVSSTLNDQTAARSHKFTDCNAFVGPGSRESAIQKTNTKELHRIWRVHHKATLSYR